MIELNVGTCSCWQLTLGLLRRGLAEAVWWHIVGALIYRMVRDLGFNVALSAA